MAITTSAALNGLFNNIYERAVFVAREMNLMVGLVSNYSGNTFAPRNLSTRPQVSAEKVVDGVDYNNSTTFGRTSVGTLTPSQAIAQVILTDVDVANDPDNAMLDASQEMGAAIATGIDEDLVAHFDDFTTDVGPGAGNAATLAKVAVGVSVLRGQKVSGIISVVLHPYQWHDIWVLLGQPSANQALLGDVANEALRQYFVGNFVGANWFTSANITIDGNADAIGGIFTPEALAFDSRQAPTLEPERDASLRAWEMNMVAGYATGLGKRPNFGVKYTSDATTPS
jgi:hypothetical protein